MKALHALLVGLVALLWSMFAAAEGLADITAAVDFSAVVAAIIAVAVAVAAVYVTARGAGLILKAIRGR